MSNQREDLDLIALDQWAEFRDIPDDATKLRLFGPLCDDLAATLRELEAARKEIRELKGVDA